MDRIVDCTKSHARLDDVAVGMTDVGRDLPSEHHVELREAEDERVALVDERDVESVAEGLGKNRRQLEPTKSRAENHDARLHGVLPLPAAACRPYRIDLCQRPGCGTIRMYGFGALQPFGIHLLRVVVGHRARR